MLRTVSYMLVLGLLAIAFVAITVNGAAAIPFAVFPALLLIGLLCERYLYKPIQDVPPSNGWQRTAERFVDPKSGRSVVVYYNARTGERRYVADG